MCLGETSPWETTQQAATQGRTVRAVTTQESISSFEMSKNLEPEVSLYSSTSVISAPGCQLISRLYEGFTDDTAAINRAINQ